jgi:hypothetical protein
MDGRAYNLNFVTIIWQPFAKLGYSMFLTEFCMWQVKSDQPSIRPSARD